MLNLITDFRYLPFPFQRRDSLTGSPGRRFTLGETTVDVDGPFEAAMYDPKSGDVVLRINGTLVRIRAKVPR